MTERMFGIRLRPFLATSFVGRDSIVGIVVKLCI